jgi:hypothetical protein
VEVWDHWYVPLVGDQTLRQGDIFRDLLIYSFPQDLPVPAARPAPGASIPVDVEWARGDWIIMSASCDVDRPARFYPQVVLGRVLPATPVTLGTHGDKEYAERIEVLKKGLEPTRFMLAQCPPATPPLPLSVVQYRVHVTMPADYLRRNCEAERLRLRHPIREVFGSWVGANIARVGPEDHILIPPNPDVRTWPVHVLKASDAD